MATTTNYSWTTPDDTDLVKDGASAIRTLGSAIDTTVFNNAGAAIQKSIVDAAGDLIYATADDTPARLAIGTAGQVLQVNSGATAPEWAAPATGGGMTLISTITLSGATNVFSSIPATYEHLQVLIYGATNSSGANVSCYPNASTGGGWGSESRGAGFTLSIGNGIYLADFTNTLGTHSTNAWIINFYNYASATARKPFDAWGAYADSTNTARAMRYYGHWNITAAITSININSGGTLTAGTAELWGIK
jgi:hypothetical protein